MRGIKAKKNSKKYDLINTQIEDLCKGLSNAWKDLLEKVGERSHALDLSLKAQEFFFEAGEVESWLVEKNDVLNSTDYGRDRDAATKLLTKHKVGIILTVAAYTMSI